MKTLKFVLLSILFYFPSVVSTQNILINFTGSGMTNIVDSVQVKNLSQGTMITVSGNDTLHLVNTTTTVEAFSQHDQSMYIYPNPFGDQTMISFYNPRHGSVIISVIDISGRNVLSLKRFLAEGRHNFNIGGLSKGNYLLNVALMDNILIGRMITTGVIAAPFLEHYSVVYESAVPGNLKSMSEIIIMHFEEGEQLHIKGFGAGHARVITMIPEQSQTIEFDFLECKDADENQYAVVTIGGQIWMAENLRTTTYTNGLPIDYPGDDNYAWEYNTVGAYAWQNNDIAWKYVYGALYNWPAAMSANGLCPEGWKIPSDDEWIALTEHLGGLEIAGGKLKCTRTEPEDHPRFNSPNIGATNESGFTGLPGGLRGSSGSYGPIGGNGFWWSATEFNEYNSWEYHLTHDFEQFFRNNANKQMGFSVRCIKSDAVLPNVLTAEIVEITALTAVSGGNVVDDGGAPVTARGIVWSIYENPTLENNEGFTNDGEGLGEFVSQLTNLTPETVYYVRAYATNPVGNAYGDQLSFTTIEYSFSCGEVITDINGNTYNTIQLGNQCWTKENLRITNYQDGTEIPNVQDDGQWANATYGALTVYPHELIPGLNSNEEVIAAYGILYNWYAVDDYRGLCPEGWYVPSHPEWTLLENFMMSAYGLTNNPDDVNGLGNALKSCLQVNSPLGGDCATGDHPRWNVHNIHFGNDMAGFSALPAGRRRLNGVYFDIGNYGMFWTASEHTTTHAINRTLFSSQGNIAGFFSTNYRKTIGFSVRCIKE